MLSDTNFARLRRIWSNREWKTEVYTISNDQIFERTAIIANSIPENEQTVFLDLFEKYLVVCDYRKQIMHFQSWVSQYLSGPGNYCVVPVTDGWHVKSGHVVQYELKAAKSAWQISSAIDWPADIGLKIFKDKATSYDKILIVDDFIGSGDQVSAFIDRLLADGVSPANCAVLVFVINEIGLRKIHAKSVHVEYKYLRTKAITDRFAVPEGVETSVFRDTYLSLFNRIAGCTADWDGYEHTESLVSMKRTPDNTLPVFSEHNLKGVKPWHAPFPRD